MEKRSTGDPELDEMLYGTKKRTAAEDFQDYPETEDFEDSKPTLPGKNAKNGRFETGNKFWLQRSKHGRDMLFETPALMREAAYEYFQYCIDNPWQKNEAIKSGEWAGQIIAVPTATPFSKVGLCLYLGCSQSYFREFKSQTATRCTPEFMTVIEEIENIIEKQQFEGATVGTFKENIIARTLGLVDKKDLTTDGEKISGNVIMWGGKEIKV